MCTCNLELPTPSLTISQKYLLWADSNVHALFIKKHVSRVRKGQGRQVFINILDRFLPLVGHRNTNMLSDSNPKKYYDISQSWFECGIVMC